MNSAVARMKPFFAMDILAEAKRLEAAGEDIIHLEAGEPDFCVHPFVAEAIQAAYGENRTHYTDSFGDIELRQAIADLYKKEYNVTVSPERILVTSGSSPALLLALQVLCDVGDEVLLSNPGYPCYRDFALACHAEPVEYPVSAENGFEPDVADIASRITPKTRALFVNAPMNPSGTLVAPETLKALADLPVTLLSDEIYHGLVYGGAHVPSVLEYTDDAFVFNGFSKRFAMTGVRLGYLIAPEKYLPALRILQQNLFICAGSAAQRAGLAAIRLLLGDDKRARIFQRDQAARVAEYDARRTFTLARARDLNMKVAVEPKGSFYVFADARRYTNDSVAFARNVLKRAHVGLTPGVDFGSRGEGFVRISYATSIDRLREAFYRLAEF